MLSKIGSFGQIPEDIITRFRSERKEEVEIIKKQRMKYGDFTNVNHIGLPILNIMLNFFAISVFLYLGHHKR